MGKREEGRGREEERREKAQALTEVKKETFVPRGTRESHDLRWLVFVDAGKVGRLGFRLQNLGERTAQRESGWILAPWTAGQACSAPGTVGRGAGGGGGYGHSQAGQGLCPLRSASAQCPCPAE